jgi:hypothetical protein
VKVERRGTARFEPSNLVAQVHVPQARSRDETEGFVLDSSLTGIALSLREGSRLPRVGANASLRLSVPDTEDSWIIPSATVVRTWQSGGPFDGGPGVALSYDSLDRGEDVSRIVELGDRRKARINAQERILFSDINYLGKYRRDLIQSELQLFIVTWTIGVALASTYFALSWYGLTTNQFATPNQSLWRMLIGALPGVFAGVAIFMTIQREIVIHKTDTFLAVLKELHIHGLYPREYRGWETAYRQYGHVYGTSRCQNCKAPKKCGRLTSQDQTSLESLRLARDPNLDPYHVLLYLSYVALIGVSFCLIAWEFISYQPLIISMVIMPAVAVVVCVSLAAAYRYLSQLRKGRFSFIQLRRIWLDILLNCRQVV